MLSMAEKIFACLAVILFASFGVQADVIHYSLTLEPDIANKSVKGSVLIRVRPASNVVEFNCGDLAIDSVLENGKPLQFSVNDHKVKVSLAGGTGGRDLREKGKELKELEIQYHGSPKRGIRFFPDRNQVYTIFSSSQWMVCVDDPSDKATLTFRLIQSGGRFVCRTSP